MWPANATLQPVHFCAFQIDCLYTFGEKLEKKHRLPDLSCFYLEDSFAAVSMGWQEKGISIEIEPKKRTKSLAYLEGLMVDLFLDTRDVKTAGYPTRFCHHFCLSPRGTPDHSWHIHELTHFRGEDKHELCDPDLCRVETPLVGSSRVIAIFLPSEALHGYDPLQFARSGFTYRISRKGGKRQYFSADDADFVIAAQPSLWASVQYIR
jgi:hypothetical protein